MGTFFPRQPIEWRIEEPPALRRFSLSLWLMAAVAGAIVGILRWGSLAIAAADDWWLIVASVALGVVVLVGAATAHMGNFPVGQWMWRAPLFGIVAGVAQAALSALLIAVGTERLGSELASWSDWPSLAARAVLWNIVIVSLFALVLAGTVQLVRTLLLPDRR